MKWVVDDFTYAEDYKRHAADRADTYWKMYLVEKRYADQEGRANVVAPHGGAIVRLLRPQIKREILAVDPFVRATVRKRELADMAPLLDKRMAHFIDVSDVRTTILTHCLTEALVFGNGWFKLGSVSHTRPAMVNITDINGNTRRESTLQLEYEGPWCWHIPWEDAYPYPVARTMQDLDREGYFVHRFFKRLSDLEQSELYDQDAVGKIRREMKRGHHSGRYRGSLPIDQIFSDRRDHILGMSADQFEHRRSSVRERDDDVIECLEIMADGQLYTVLNRTHIGREESMDHRMPIGCLIPDPIAGELTGKSVYHDSTPAIEQREILMNAVHDNVARQVHGVFKAMPGMYDETTLYPGPGGVIHVHNMNGFEPLEQPDTISRTAPVLARIDRDIEMGSGLTEIFSNVGAGQGTVYPETATVGGIKADNAGLFIAEMISNIEQNGLKRLASIYFDIALEQLGPESWYALAGEEGHRWKDVDADTLARNLDWKIVGSSYASSQQQAAQAAIASINPMLQIHAADPGVVDLRELGKTVIHALGVDNDRIIRQEPRDQGPDAEHIVMKQGLPVDPELDENIEQHLQAHLVEFQRVNAGQVEPDEFVDENAMVNYLQRLGEHIEATQVLFDRIAQATAVVDAQAGAGNGQPSTPASGAASGASSQDGGPQRGSASGGGGSAPSGQ